MLRTGLTVNDLLIIKQIAKEFPRTAGRIMEPTVMYNDERMEKIRGWMLRSDTLHPIRLGLLIRPHSKITIPFTFINGVIN